MYRELHHKRSAGRTDGSLIAVLLLICWVAAQLSGESFAGGSQSIAITPTKRSQPVDFGRDLLPILKKNCLACHNQTVALGGLTLETRESVLRGGNTGQLWFRSKAMRAFFCNALLIESNPSCLPSGMLSARLLLLPTS